MKAPIKVWGVAALAKTQEAATNAHCFGDCGKISMAGVIDDELTGGLFICCEQQCPYVEKEFPGYGTTMSFGEPHEITLRLLREE
jgi:hypothetical protein